MEAVDSCGSEPFSLCRTPVSVHRNGDNVFASRAEVRKQDMSGNHPSGKSNGWNGRGLASARVRTRLTQINSLRQIGVVGTIWDLNVGEWTLQ